MNPATTRITEVYKAVKPSPAIKFWYLSQKTLRKIPLMSGASGSVSEVLVDITPQYTLLVSLVEFPPSQYRVRLTP